VLPEYDPQIFGNLAERPTPMLIILKRTARMSTRDVQVLLGLERNRRRRWRTEPRPAMEHIYAEAYETYRTLSPALKPIINRPL